MTEEHGRGASLDQGTAVDDQGTYREVAVAVAGGGGSGSGGQGTGARAAKGVRVQP